MHWTRTQLSILGIVATTSFMSTFLISAVNIALPAIEKSFDLNAVTLSWVITSFLLSTGMVLLPAGRWGDLTGVRRLFKWGVVLFTASTVLCAVAPSGLWLIVFRFLQGIGAALVSSTGPAILVAAFPPQYRGRVLGISVSAVYLGLAFGPFFGGILTQQLGWRSIFWISTLMGAIVIFITFCYLGTDSELPPKTERKVKLRGVFLYMLGLVALVYGSGHIPGSKGWLLMGTGALFLVLFWLVESRSTKPVFNTRLFTRNRLFAFSNLAALINYSATFAIVFLLSLYLQKVQEFSPQKAGTILIAQPVMMALFSPLAGRLSDRFQPRYLASLGMSMCALALLVFAFFTTTTPVWLIVALLIWVGLGFAFFSSPNMNTIMGSVDKSRYGVASGTAATMRVIGQMVSMTIATIFFSWFFGKQGVDDVSVLLFLKAMKWSFLIFSGIAFAGIYFSFSRGRIKR